ncbi:MAG: GNAT family N-acetyltransferase [Kiritimatiellae bacterium]|nr:GNAT family N-acetyltransferase [Kiritimatiellia bacterium]
METTATETGVIILFNEPTPAGGFPGAQTDESDAGVLREVDAVACALGLLGVRHRRMCARTLREVGTLLSSSVEKVVINLVERLERSVFDACLAPAVCEALGKSYTGNSATTQIMALDKWIAKCVLEAGGVRVPRGHVVPLGTTPGTLTLDAAEVIIKPLRSDASEGIQSSSVVSTRDVEGIEREIHRIHRHFQQAALAEEYINGREINVSLLERQGELVILPLAEIDFSAFPPEKPRIVDYAAKWIESSFEYLNTPRKIPAQLDDQIAEKIRRCARLAWHCLGCRDYARVDIRLDEHMEPWVIEVNPNPDISPDAGFAAALEAAGISFAEFIATLLENAGWSGRPICSEHIQAAMASRAGELLVRWSQPEDAESILRIVESSGVFRLHEIDVAREVLHESLSAGPAGHYQSYTAVAGNRVAGWICFGPTPCTEGTFDIYWIVVDPNVQRRGTGSALLARAEAEIRRRNGRLSIIETSSRAVYEPARTFYVRHGYKEGARVRNFYGPGDDKVVFVKCIRDATKSVTT